MSTQAVLMFYSFLNLIWFIVPFFKGNAEKLMENLSTNIIILRDNVHIPERLWSKWVLTCRMPDPKDHQKDQQANLQES